MPLESDRAEAGQFARDFGVKFPVIFDPKMKIAEAYGAAAIPYNVVIDRSGNVARILVGADPEALEKAAREQAEKR